jgi:hypothetical protein
MRLRDGEQVATLAPVVGSDDDVEVEIPDAAIGSDGEPEREASAEEPPA